MDSSRIFVSMNATFKDEEKCRIAMKTIVSDAHAAYGVHSHFWFRSNDGKSLFVLEQYEDKKALRKAIRRFTAARISFFKSIDVIKVNVYGSISISSKLMFAALSPQYMDYYEGYSRNEAISETTKAGIQESERKRILITSHAIIKDEEQCKVAMRRFAEDAHVAPGVHTHYISKSKDGKALFVLEQYANEKALIDHITSNPPSRTDFLATIEVTDVTIYGTAHEQIKEKFAPLHPTFMNYYGGYSK